MNIKEKHKLRKFIKELESVKGRHTELVSVYVPAGYDIIKIIQHLEQEGSTASNIKDARTRKNVIDSLERAIRHLRLFKRTPENGLAVFAGNASESENKIDIKVWSVEPPEPLNFRLYRCDQNFMLEPLKGMLEHKEVYGLIVLDKREGNIGLLKGHSITELRDLTSGVPGKFKTGGQSSQRLERMREGMAKEFFVRIGEAANVIFLDMKENLKGIIIGGPGPTKEEFLAGHYLNNELKRKVIGVKDLSYTGEFGLNELVDKSHDLLAKEEIIEEKKILTRFFEMLGKEPGKVSYGKIEVNRVLEMAAVDKLLLSESLGDEDIEKWEEKAEKYGTEVVIISTETREGVQLRDLGGIAAILRYEIR